MIARWRTLSPYWRRTTLRLALLPLILFLLYTAVFVLLEVVYEPPTHEFYGLGATEEDIQALREEFGLNDSMWEKYQDFWQSVFTLDFGPSLVNLRESRESLNARWATSAQLLIMSAVVGGATATLLAVVSRKWPRLTGAVRAVAISIAALPLVALSVFVIVYPQEWWGYLPPGLLRGRVDFTEDPWDNFRQYAVPAATIGVLVGAWSWRVAREAIADASLSPATLALAAAAAAADGFQALLGSLLVVEQIFGLPGLGPFFLYSIVLEDTNSAAAMLVPGLFIAVSVWSIAPPLARFPRPSPQTPTIANLLRSKPLLAIGLGIAALFIVLGVVGSWVAPYGAHELAGFPHEDPSWDYWLGTQRDGHDQLSLLLYSTRNSLELASLVVVIGVLPGGLAGWLLRRLNLAGKFDGSIVPVCAEGASMLLALPVHPIALLFFIPFDFQTSSIAYALAGFAFVLSVRAVITAGDGRNSLAAVVGAAALGVAGSIAIQTSVSFFVIYPDRPAFGQILNDARHSYPYHHIVMFSTTAAIAVFTAGFLLIRTALDDLDPPRLYER